MTRKGKLTKKRKLLKIIELSFCHSRRESVPEKSKNSQKSRKISPHPDAQNKRKLQNSYKKSWLLLLLLYDTPDLSSRQHTLLLMSGDSRWKQPVPLRHSLPCPLVWPSIPPLTVSRSKRPSVRQVDEYSCSSSCLTILPLFSWEANTKINYNRVVFWSHSRHSQGVLEWVWKTPPSLDQVYLIPLRFARKCRTIFMFKKSPLFFARGFCFDFVSLLSYSKGVCSKNTRQILLRRMTKETTETDSPSENDKGNHRDRFSFGEWQKRQITQNRRTFLLSLSQRVCSYDVRSSGYKSFHDGFLDSISATFSFRRKCFISFSLAIAL